MEISSNVAYRCYALKEQYKAIAFNTKTRKYMFLEGLSAELLDRIIKNENISGFLEDNELTKEDVDWFKQQLSYFGFIENVHSNSSIAENASDYNKENEHKEELEKFMIELGDNGLYYSFHIDLTNKCNEKCVHCYHPFDKYDYSKEMSTDDVQALVDKIYELGVFSVTLSGGEALLRKDFFEILAYISKKGMMTSIYTNGMLLSEDVVKKIRSYRVEVVSISLYGSTPAVHDSVTRVQGSYQKTIEGITLLKKYEVPFGLKCVLMENNIHHINDVIELSKELNNGQGCKIEFLLSGKVNGDCSNLEYKASAENIAKVFISLPENQNDYSHNDSPLNEIAPCGAGKYSLYCSADGKIYPCVAFRLYLCEWKDLLNIHNNPILKKWLGVRLSDFSDCKKHDYCKYCLRTCAGDNLVENGNYLDSTDVGACRQAKAIFALVNN